MSSFFGIKVGSEQKEPNARENSTAAEEESSSLDSLLSTLPQDSKITEPQTTKMTEPQTMLSKAKSFLAEQRKSLAPWSEFAATPSNPKTVGEATKRVLYNVDKFKSNYVVVILLLAAYAIVTSPLLLFSIALVYAGLTFASMRTNDGPLLLFGKQYTSQDLTRATLILAVPLLYLSSATSTLFWLIGASLVVVLAHGALIAIPAPEQLEQSA